MACAIIAATRPAYEPLYDVDPHTGASIEVFHADKALAASFGRCSGWFWWKCWPGCLPDDEPRGPFPTAYVAYVHGMTEGLPEGHLQLRSRAGFL